MSSIARRFLFFIMAFSLVAPAAAQDEIPRVSLVHPGADRLKEDLKFLLSLTNETEQKQTEVVLDYVELFQSGVDPTRPICMDLLIENQAIRYLSSFPVADLDDFLDNVDSFGIQVSRRGSSLYQLKKAFEGYMRFDRRLGYASISESRDDVPISMPDPREPVRPLIEAGYDVGAQLVNSADNQESRRTSFANVREELMAAVKQMQNESAEDFEVRRLLTEQQINEVERYFVEAAKVLVGWTTDIESRSGSGELQLYPIPDSDLAATIAQLQQTPSDFANVAQNAEAILSGRINHPLDEFRVKQLLEAYEVLEARGKARIDGTQLTDEQKTVAKQMTEMVFEMLAAGAEAKMLDGFVEVVTNASGKHTIYGAIRSPDGTKADAIVALVPDLMLNATAELKFAEHENVSIHKLVIPDEDLEFIEFLSDDRSVLLGTSPEAVWYAAGEGALEKLKEAITAAGAENAGNADAPFFTATFRAGPWVRLRDKRLAKREDKGNEQVRKLALEAFEGDDDRVTVSLRRVEDHVVGKMQVDVGILRFAGKLVAMFSKENLEAE